MTLSFFFKRVQKKYMNVVNVYRRESTKKPHMRFFSFLYTQKLFRSKDVAAPYCVVLGNVGGGHQTIHKLSLFSIGLLS
jgi:hypothetical protein